MKIAFAFLLGLITLPVLGFLYLRFGSLPVAVADHPLPMERYITSNALHRRISTAAPTNPPLSPTPDNLVAGAHVYQQHCAMCHGLPNQPSPMHAMEFPHPPGLWMKHGNSSVVGVSDDPPGHTFWLVQNGIRLSGMPAYRDRLSDTEMWQVSELLANADKPLPNPVTDILAQPLGH